MKYMRVKIFIISLFAALAFVFYFSLNFKVYASNPYTEPTKNSEGFYEIGTKDELYWFSYEINTNRNYTYNAILTSDITLNSEDLSTVSDRSTLESFPMIGDNVKNSASFQGVFDGNNHKISGVYINAGTLRMVGFFGHTKKCTIKDLTLDNIYYEGTPTSNLYIGGLVGYATQSTKIYNVSVSGVVESNVEEIVHMGGIVGYMQGSYQKASESVLENSISHVSLKTTTSKESHLGGIVGYLKLSTIKDNKNYATIQNDVKHQIGGIAGYSISSVIDHCINYGNITTPLANAGGIVGESQSKNITKNSINYGTINAYNSAGIVAKMTLGRVENGINEGTIIATSYAGGIVAGMRNRNTELTGAVNNGEVSGEVYSAGICAYAVETKISNAKNNGYVHGGQYAAGIAAYSASTIMASENHGDIKDAKWIAGIAAKSNVIGYSYNTGSVESNVENAIIGGIAATPIVLKHSYNIGNIIKSYDTQQVGSIAGEVKVESIVDNCYYTNDLKPIPQEFVKNHISKITTSDLTSGRLCYLLNKKEYFTQKIGVDLYPVLDGGDSVYLNCDHGTFAYSNTKEESCHEYINGICTCGAVEAPEIALDGTYLIKNLGNLIYFRNEVNNGLNYANAKLVDNIVVNQNLLSRVNVSDHKITSLNKDNLLSWVPIGNGRYPFNGTFDGNHYFISGLFSDDIDSYSGLFGMIGARGIVQRFKVKESIFITNRRNIDPTLAYHSGVVYGANVGIVDDVFIDSCFLGVDVGTEAYLIPHDNINPLEKLSHEGNYIIYYIDSPSDRFVNIYNEEYYFANVDLYFEGEGIITKKISYYDTTDRTVSIDGVSVSHHEIIDHCYIGEGITEIGERALDIGVRQISLPNTLKVIHPFGIAGTILGEVYLPKSLERIEENGLWFLHARAIYIPKNTYLEDSFINSGNLIFYEGTKEEFIAHGGKHQSNYVYECELVGNRGSLSVVFEYDGLENPYSGTYLLVSYNDGEKRIPIANKKEFKVTGLKDNTLIHLSIVLPNNEVIKDLGSLVLNEENSYTYKKEVVANQKFPSIKVGLKDENGELIYSGYKVNLYKGSELYQSQDPENREVVFKGLPNGKYLVEFVFYSNLAYSYQDIKDLEIDLVDNDYEKYINLSLIKDKDITLKLFDEEEEIVPYADYIIEEIYADGYRRFYNGSCDENGVAIVSIHNVLAKYTIKKEGYYSLSGDINSSDKSVSITLDEVPGIPLYYNVFLSCNDDLVMAIKDLTEDNIDIYNVSKNEKVTGFYLSEAKIYLPTLSVEYGDTLRFKIVNIENTYEKEMDYVLEENGILNIPVLEKSYFLFKDCTGYAYIYKKNEVIESINTRKVYKSSYLEGGDYKVFIVEDFYGKHIGMEDVAKYNLVEGVNYFILDIHLDDHMTYEINNYHTEIKADANTVINYSDCRTAIKQNSLCIGEYQNVTMNLSYNTFTSGELVITVPKNCIYINESLRVNGLERNVIINGNKLTLSITKEDVIVEFIIQATKDSKFEEINSSIIANDRVYPLPSTSFSIYLVDYSIYFLKKESSKYSTIEVSGKTIGYADIYVYDNGELFGKYEANSLGYFKITGIIDVRCQKHDFYCEVITLTSKKIKSITHTLTLDSLELMEAEMFVINDDYTHGVPGTFFSTPVGDWCLARYDLLNKKKLCYRVALFYREFTYKVQFLMDMADSVFVETKTVSGTTIRIPLTYDYTEGKWIGKYDTSLDDLPIEFSILYSIQGSPLYVSHVVELDIANGVDNPYSYTRPEKKYSDEFNVSSVEANLVSEDTTTFRIRGSMLNNKVEYTFGNDTVTREPLNVYYVSLEEAYVTFDLKGLEDGTYQLTSKYKDKEISKPVVMDTNLIYGTATYELNVSDSANVGDTLIGHVLLRNIGYTDLETKIFLLKGDDIQFENGKNYLFDIVTGNGLLGTILPQEEAGYNFKYKVTGENPKISIYFIDSTEEKFLDAYISGAVGFDAIFENMHKEMGTNSKTLQAAAAKMANYLSTIGYKEVSLEEIYYAIGQKARSSFGSDALTIETSIKNDYFRLYRIYDKTLDGHLEDGIFGKGWKSNFEMRIEKKDNYYLLYDPVDEIVLRYNGDSYTSLHQDYILKEIGSEVYGSNEENTFVFENNRLTKVFIHSKQYYSISYTDGKISTINGLYDTLTFSYSNGYVDKLYLNGDLYETYFNNHGFLTGIRGLGSFNYTYVLDELSPRYGLLLTEEVNDDIVTYSYDDLGRLTSAISPLSNVSYEYYDGLLVKMNNNGVSTLLYFDINGNLVKEISDTGLIKEIAQEDSVIHTMVNNLYQSNVYDNDGRLSMIIFTDGSKLTFNYGSDSITITDALNHAYQYFYNENHDVTKIIYPDDTYQEYTYNNGFLTEERLRDGSTVSYTYNSIGKMERMEYSDGSYVEYEYDTDTSLKKISDATYSMMFTYDSSGRLSKVTYKDGLTLEYTYDELNRVSQLKNPLGYVTKYEFTQEGYISKVKNNGGSTITEYTYDSYGRMIKQKNSNSSYTEYEYDGSMVKSIINYGKSKEILSKFVYSYNSYGLIDSLETIDGVFYYEYDSMGRIAKIKSDNLLVIYEYDSLGNRISMSINGNTTSYTSNELNQYIFIDNKELSYDLCGRLIEFVDGTTTYTYQYNAKGQLVSLSDGTNQYSYTYDFFGNRDSITLNGVTTNYYYTPNEAGILLASKTGTQGASYIYGNGLVATYQNSKLYYYDFDMLGNVHEIVNSSGVVQNSYKYDANFSVIDKAEAINNPFTYIGKKGYIDDGSTLYHVGLRDVLKGDLFFTTPERHSLGYGINLYQYAAGNHINYIDEEGDCPVLLVVAGAVAAGIGYNVINQGVCDAYSGSMSSLGTYAGAVVSGAFSGLAGFVGAGTGGLAAAGALGINALGAGIGSLTAAWVDSLITKNKVDWTSELAKAGLAMGVSALFGKIGDKLFPDYMLTHLQQYFPTTAEFVFNVLKNFLTQKFQDLCAGLYGLVGLPLIDPSGYVCEAVDSNRIEGVKCTIYYSSVSSGAGAIQYVDETGQENPLFTDNEGKYGWDVPFGYCQVKFEKEGYFTAYSEWLPVPPEQLDVNICLISINAPGIEECEIKKNEIILKFTQYMMVDDINKDKIAITVDGNRINGTFTAVNQEAYFNDANISLAKEFKFTPGNEFNGMVQISIVDVRNYAETTMDEAYSKSYDFSTNQNPTPIDPEPTTPEPTDPTIEEKDSALNNSGLPVGAVVGISIGAVVVLASIGVLVFFIIKKKKSSARE